MTVYFINEGLSELASGIEKAQIYRATLFRAHNVQFKLLTSNFLPNLHSTLATFNLVDAESVNLFDYFQHALLVKSTIIKPEDADFGVDVMLKQNTDTEYFATVKDQLVGRIQVNAMGHVERLEYFDGFGNLYRTTTYDSRGFKSMSQLYSPDNQVEVQIWYDVTGRIAIEKTFSRTTHGNQIETWKIDNLLFHNFAEVRCYFYNCLNAVGENMFIMDRTNGSEWQLAKLERPAYIILMLHNHHSSDDQDPTAEILNDNYEWSLANMDQWNCVVSATPQQTLDVSIRWKNVTKYFTVPVGVIQDDALQQVHIPMKQRQTHSMLVTARVAAEKGINKMIQALAIARQSIPDLTLDIYGYVDDTNNHLAMNLIGKSLPDLDDQSAVTFHDFTPDVASLHEQYQVYLVYSRMEGFNLELMEALSSGMVGLTNHVNYGPTELIKSGQNGAITEYDDVAQYAAKMVELFQNSDQLQEMSENAYRLSNRYSSANVWRAWQKVFTDYYNWIGAKKINK